MKIGGPGLPRNSRVFDAVTSAWRGGQWYSALIGSAADECQSALSPGKWSVA